MTELFSAILKASFQGSVVILAVIALRFLLKKAPKSLFCLLWLLAGLRLVMLFEIPSPLSLQPRLEDTNLSIQAQQPVQVPDIVIQNPAGQPLDTPAEPVQTPNLPGANVQTDSFLYEVEGGKAEPIRYGDIAAQIWLLGAAGMLIASLVSYLRLKRRVREAFLIENGCFECPGLNTAFVLGFLPPRIYLPLGLSDQEKKFIFDHENTHIARHDHWFKVLGYVVLSIHWFNPLVWLGYGLLCRDMELACDEHVVKYMTLPERKAYSAALLSCGGKTARISACPVALGESNPKKRILNVLNYKRPSFWIILLAVAAILFVSVCLLTSPENQVEEPEETMKWNLEMQVTDVTPSGLRAEFIQHGVINPRDGGELMFGSEYTLEKWVDGSWEPVEMLPQEHDVAWTTEAYLIGQNSTAPFQVDWEWLYGQLPPGQYRIGKGVTLRYYLLGDTEHESFYGEFEIAQSTTGLESEEEILQKCREAMIELQNREKLHLDVQNLENSKDEQCDYIRTEKGWMIECCSPLWNMESMIWLQMENEGYVYWNNEIDTGLRTAPYYWQVDEYPERHIFRLPFPFDQDWKNIELTYLGTETDWQSEMIHVGYPENGSVFTFYFTLDGTLGALDIEHNDAVQTYARIYVRDVYGVLEQYYEQAVAEVGTKPQPLDDAYYAELFTRKADGAYVEVWIWDLFETFYRDPVGFLNQLSRNYPEQADDILWLMSQSSPYYALARFQWVLDELQDASGVDQTLVAKLRQYALVPSENLTADQCMEKCRNALDAYQAQGSWVILVENSFSGEAVLTENNAQLWYIDGEDWARMSVISNSDFLQENWHLCKEGNCYSKDSCTIHYPGNGEGYCNGWQDFEDISHWPMPWPLEFDWDHAEITYVEARTDGQSTMVHLRVAGNPNPEGYGEQAEDYLLTLWLRPSGELWQVRLEYTSTERMGEKTHICTTIGLNAAAPEEAQRMVAQCHSEAMLHIHGICNDPKCTDSAHDHSGINCTDKNCTNSTHHHNDEHHDDKHHH